MVTSAQPLRKSLQVEIKSSDYRAALVPARPRLYQCCVRQLRGKDLKYVASRRLLALRSCFPKVASKQKHCKSFCAGGKMRTKSGNFFSCWMKAPWQAQRIFTIS